jgi:hypothetical protein
MACNPSATLCFSERISVKGQSGFTWAGNLLFSFLPLVYSTSTGKPATPFSGCSTTKPVRLVAKSVSGVAVASKVSVPSAPQTIVAS